ncbi:MAG: hypothetical protein KJ971_08590, partial [Firmicutes bacterium]|nr:hypothetical protein [Bacillota bacterium]
MNFLKRIFTRRYVNIADLESLLASEDSFRQGLSTYHEDLNKLLSEMRTDINRIERKAYRDIEKEAKPRPEEAFNPQPTAQPRQPIALMPGMDM